MAAPSEYVLEPLREGPDFTLYRGWQRGNPSPVLVAALTVEQSSPQGLRRLEHEYSLAAELEPAWAAKPLTLTRHEGRTILVLKDPGGEPLDLVLERDQGRPLDLARVLHIAIGLAVALGQVHRRGLIHKDIKPANVLVGDNGNVWLTGFGIASQLPHERQSPVPIEIIDGTLAYMAPEQTGRMNRSIDTRSDLYSLGVTLYQMLTGTLPFAAAAPLEWVHCHIARQPAPPCDRAAVPEPLSAIVMKLLAKNAEERYQTASGLEADLRQCRAEWESHGRINLFPLGAHDTIGASVGQLDVATVVKASQALSSEILLPKLIEKLLRIALEHAGAERGLLILLRGGEPQIEAEATTAQGRVEVTVRRAAITPYDLPQAALHYVIRTGERVVLDDPSTATLYSKHEYVRTKRTLSVLCLPIVKQTKLIGALYLENTLTPRAYTPDRIAVLEMLVSQATISLENATLFSDLHRSEAYLAEGQSISHTGSFGWNVLSGEIYWSEETYKIFEYDRSVKPTLEAVLHRIHPDDRDRWRESIDRMTHQRTDYEIDYRLLIPDGSVKYLHVATRALENSSGDLEFVGTATDVTAAKQAEDKIRQSEMELRQILEFTPQQIAVLGPDGTPIYSNQANLDYLGFTLQEWQSYDHRRLVHPDDFEQTMSQNYSKFLSGLRYEAELRLRGTDGRYRWFLVRHNPLHDAEGHLLRWYITGTDIEDRKQAEKRLQNENVALREEVDRASMFEEIVGASPALRAVLARVSKVAPTDSTVLITGETGTGKELIARAVHKRSQRSSQAFVSVNCAAIPRDLIASELFGHEKGAFTGAVQRRLGRFELAEGGTIFLDEIGELPAETQIALLRVLQEREFERVGGTLSIRTNVRLIAATNRDLQAAISASTFRRDLFYRLNVFPIEVPPLRERREDILVLVEYFIDRFARKAGKSFRCADKQSLELLQSYPWPGNIRELQNIIERSVIVCDTENFSVDERWLSRQPHAREPKSQPKFSQNLASREKEMIEEALRESGGRVSGPSGAAAKLGLPGSTLDSKIRSLQIDKNRFKSIQPSTDRT